MKQDETKMTKTKQELELNEKQDETNMTKIKQELELNEGTNKLETLDA